MKGRSHKTNFTTEPLEHRDSSLRRGPNTKPRMSGSGWSALLRATRPRNETAAHPLLAKDRTLWQCRFLLARQSEER